MWMNTEKNILLISFIELSEQSINVAVLLADAPLPYFPSFMMSQ